MIKVAIIGPESSGKTDLALALTKAYDAAYVAEYSRKYLERIGTDYKESDLLEIAKGQVELVRTAEAQNPELLIADTDLHVMKVWSNHKYGRTAPWILDQLSRQNYSLYILTYYDIPYEEDPLRENPEERAYFFDIYFEMMRSKRLPFIVVKGGRESRLSQVKESIDTLL